jgi:hypothetical protein
MSKVIERFNSCINPINKVPYIDAEINRDPDAWVYVDFNGTKILVRKTHIKN